MIQKYKYDYELKWGLMAAGVQLDNNIYKINIQTINHKKKLQKSVVFQQ